jgi:3-deoxy-manno-octulosonate cytidylyltransferase (CMP-KDO synthetase)
MIQKVYLQSKKSKYLKKIFVLTDDERIKKTIEDINGDVILIKDDCLNGTERICIALKRYNTLFNDYKFIVNIQGDEPYINPEHIDIAIEKMLLMNDINIKCSTLIFKILSEKILKDTSIGKVVLNNKNEIIYCSRNVIPASKTNNFDLVKNKYYGHIGLFVFDKKYLIEEYIKENTPLQIIEDIEWLKIIEQDYKIISSEVSEYEIGVNNIEDYNYLKYKYNF